MAYLILLLLAAIAVIFAVLFDKVRHNKIERKAAEEYQDEIILPTTVLTIELEDCVITESKSYHERSPGHTKLDMYRQLKSNYNPSADKKEVTYVVLKYDTEYNGKPFTFKSPRITVDRITLMMKMIQQKQTRIEIYEDDNGDIEDYDFYLDFLNASNQ